MDGPRPASPASTVQWPSGQERRGFLAKAVALGAGALALLPPVAVTALASLNPLRQKGAGGQSLRLTTLDLLPDDGKPHKVPVITDRTDAWTRFTNEPVGAVYLVRHGDKVEALQVICPHAGCYVTYDSEKNDFHCPCHGARFDLAGKRTDAASVSPRDLDSIQVEIRDGEVWVRFEKFRLNTADKIAEA